MAIKDIFSEVEEVKQDIENLGVDDLKRELQDNPDLLLIDLREIQERVDLGAIPGSIHAPRGMLEFWASPPAPITGITSKKIAGRFCSAPEADVQSLQRLRCWIWVSRMWHILKPDSAVGMRRRGDRGCCRDQ